MDAVDRHLGCLLAGAVGDALGAGVEFSSLEEILTLHGATRREPSGPLGLRRYVPAYGRRGAITDDTQMTLFTAEGLLRAHNRRLGTGHDDPTSAVFRAYLRWFDTQRLSSPPPRPDGWLAGQPALYARRGPGNTCLSALRTGLMGTVERPINNSKGCGGVMRVAPVGLAPEWDAFELGCSTAAITHGHPLGWLSAGFIAQMVRSLLEGGGLSRAVDTGLRRLRGRPGAEPLVALVERAMDLAEVGDPSPDDIATLGQGWVAEETVAIALYCAASVDSLEDGLALAVLHDGDSDSTAAVAGHLLGTLHGVQAIPSAWLDELELADVIRQVALDLHDHFAEPDFVPSDADRARYPG